MFASNSSLNKTFSETFKTLRLRSGYLTLKELSYKLAANGLEVDPSLLSHWQRGARLPSDRKTILIIIRTFRDSEHSISELEANLFCEQAGMGFLTEKEKQSLFPRYRITKERVTPPTTPLKIYFTAAIAQKDVFGKEYQVIVDTLRVSGHIVYEDTTFTSLEEAVYKSPTERNMYYKKVLQWLNKANVLVTEVSFPSTLHIGHEITLALERNKPVIAFYKKGFEPSFFLGMRTNTIEWVEYQDSNLGELVKYHITQVSLVD